MKTICWWLGTDALTLVTNPPGNRIWHVKLIFYRLKWKLMRRLFKEHWVDHERLTEHLVKFGVPACQIKTVNDPPRYAQRFKKIKHVGVNILYYMPKTPANLGGMKFLKWLYGYDVYLQIKKYFPELNFIEVDGSQDMSKIYPIVDIYIRPTRHDGASRMLKECDINGIVCIFSPDLNPDAEEYIKQIKYRL